MTEKTHQVGGISYQIRIDGRPVRYPAAINRYELKEWLRLCEENPSNHVDIAVVKTEIFMSLHHYNLMKIHFAEENQASSGG